MRLARGFCRVLPARSAAGVIRRVVDRMDPAGGTLSAARANQFVVSGGMLTGAALKEQSRANVRMMGTFLYDLYHVLFDYAAEDAIIIRDEAYRSFFERERDEGPFVYTGIHLGNFDLVGRALGRDGFHTQLLSVAAPNAGYEWQNAVRAEAGFDVTPVTMESLKQAARNLEAGRSVITGHDRPLDAPDKVLPRFFGHAAPMPLLHVRLAMRAGLKVVAIAAPRDPDGRYRLLHTDPIPIEGGRPDPERLLLNAERCLAAVEPWIAAAPEQWAMPHRVWPDIEPTAEQETPDA